MLLLFAYLFDSDRFIDNENPHDSDSDRFIDNNNSHDSDSLSTTIIHTTATGLSTTIIHTIAMGHDSDGTRYFFLA
jgi:hypothetical protein